VTDPMVIAISDNIDRIITFLNKQDTSEEANNLRSEEMLKSYLKGAGIYDENDKNADAIVSALNDTYYQAEYQAKKEEYSQQSIQSLADAFLSTNTAKG
jgi:hypothetical protein